MTVRGNLDWTYRFPLILPAYLYDSYYVCVIATANTAHGLSVYALAHHATAHEVASLFHEKEIFSVDFNISKCKYPPQSF